MSSWKDATSWSQSDTAEDRKTPRAWELRDGSFCVLIHGHIYYEKEDWLVTCRSLGFEKMLLKSKNTFDGKAEDAKAEALRIVRRRLNVYEQTLTRWENEG